jgi:hypothetical protein
VVPTGCSLLGTFLESGTGSRVLSESFGEKKHLLGIYSDFMGIYSDLMGIYSDLMGFYGNLLGLIGFYWD